MKLIVDNKALIASHVTHMSKLSKNKMTAGAKILMDKICFEFINAVAVGAQLVSGDTI